MFNLALAKMKTEVSHPVMINLVKAHVNKYACYIS